MSAAGPELPGPSGVRTLGALSHDELAVLGREYLLAGQLIDRAGMPHVIGSYGREVMADIAIDEWMGASPVYTRRMQRLLGFGNGDIETIFKGMQFDVGAPPEFMDFRYEVIDEHHGEFWLEHCGALMDVEPMGEDYVLTMCHTIEDPTFDATATATSPFARFLPVHRPPRVPSDRSPHCHWTAYIDESLDPLLTPEPAVQIGATCLAALPVPAVGASPGDPSVDSPGTDLPVTDLPATDPGTDGRDGWDDYTADLDPDLQLEQFSTAALRALVDEFCVQSHLLVMSFLLAIERRYSTEAAVTIGALQFAGSAGLTAQRLAQAFDLGSSLADVAQVLELHPAFRPRGYVDLRIDLDRSTEQLTVHLGECLALEESGRDSWITILADGDDAALVSAVQAVDPTARVERCAAEPGDRSTWSVTSGHEPLDEPPVVALSRFSTGADFAFAATPVTLAARVHGSGPAQSA